MVKVSGSLWDVSRNATRATEVRVHAAEYRTSDGGIITTEFTRVKVSPSGVVELSLEPGPAVLHLVGGRRNILGEVPLLVPSRDATLEECVEAAGQADGQSRKELAELIFEARETYAGMVREAERSVEAAQSASASEVAAASSASSAAASASAAGVSEQGASRSAESAGSSASAAGVSASNAKVSEGAAKRSADAAKVSEQNAARSESAAAGSASGASSSATSAKSSASAAKTSETNAGKSATSAKSSEDNAKRSADAAATSESNASKSAMSAKTSETNAQGHASDAAKHEVAAKGHADDAAKAAVRAGEIATSTSWNGDRLTVNGKTSPPLTAPRTVFTISDKGTWVIDGKDTGEPVRGRDGTMSFEDLTSAQRAKLTPEVKDGVWWVGGVSTGVKAQGEQGEPGEVGVAGPPGNTGVTLELLDTPVTITGSGDVVVLDTPKIYGTVQFAPTGEWYRLGCLVMPRVFDATGERVRDSVGGWNRAAANGGGVYRYLPGDTRELVLPAGMYVEGVELVPWGSNTATINSLVVSGAVKLPTWAALTRDPADVAAQRLVVADTRRRDDTPAWYMENHPRAVVSEFKMADTVGLDKADGNYAMVYTVVQWRDKSGGYPSQTAYHGDKIMRRVGVSDTAWGQWSEVGAVDWGTITGKPTSFPPATHSHDLLDKATDRATPGTLVKRYSDGSFEVKNTFRANDAVNKKYVDTLEAKVDSLIRVVSSPPSSPDKGVLYVIPE